MGMHVQFDEMFELTVDLDESDRNYNKLKAIYPEGRQRLRYRVGGRRDLRRCLSSKRGGLFPLQL